MSDKKELGERGLKMESKYVVVMDSGKEYELNTSVSESIEQLYLDMKKSGTFHIKHKTFIDTSKIESVSLREA